MKNTLFAIWALLFLCGCTSSNNSSEYQIDLYSAEEKEMTDYFTQTQNNIDYIVLDDSNQEALFATIDKIVVKDNKIYLLDWMNRKLLVYSSEGGYITSVGDYGRSRNEYLQITDFDVSDDGNIIIIDGQKDVIMQYSDKYELIGYQPLRSQIGQIYLAEPGICFLGIEPWDESKHQGNMILRYDSNNNEEESFLLYEKYDINAEFPTNKFYRSSPNTFLYNSPISNHVYEIDHNGEIKTTYAFDFGPRNASENLRTDYFNYENEAANACFLIGPIAISRTHIYGELYNSEQVQCYIYDRDSNILYLQDKMLQALSLIGANDKYVIYRISSGQLSYPSWLPDHILEATKSSKEVIMLLKRK